MLGSDAYQIVHATKRAGCDARVRVVVDDSADGPLFTRERDFLDKGAIASRDESNCTAQSVWVILLILQLDLLY